MLARLAILQLLIPAEALHMPMLAQQRAVAPTMSAIDRRAMLQNGPVAGALLFGLAPMVANAAEDTFSSMGGALQPYIDVQKGYKLYKPTAWNQFDADAGVYDVKFQDVIEGAEIIQVSSTPVASATSVKALGDLEEVGAKFAKNRKAELVSSSQREADGSLVYTYELKGPDFHEYLLLTINRGKLYRLNTVATNKRWPKRQELYKNVVLSFVPKGF